MPLWYNLQVSCRRGGDGHEKTWAFYLFRAAPRPVRPGKCQSGKGRRLFADDHYKRERRRQAGREIFFDRTVSRGISAAEDLHHDLTFAVSPATAAYVEQKRQDPAIRETVEEDALDAEIWWQWFDILPVDHETHLSQRAVLEWVENYMTIPEEDRAFLSYNLMRISRETLDAYTNPDHLPPPVFEAPDF